MVKEKVEIQYSVNDSGASKKIGLLSKGMQKLKDNAKMVAIAGIGLLTATITKGLKAFGVQEKAIATLNQSLKNQGNYSKQASKELQAYASSLQKVTTFGDEQILQGQALIASFGFQGEELMALTSATADLAAAKGMDFVQAADLVSKAVGSETNALSRYGVTIEGAAGSTARATSAIQAMSSVFGGQAKAQALTFAGSIQQLQNSWGDLSEEIGAVFAPMVQKVAGFLRQLADKFNAMSGPSKKMVVIIGAVTIALLSLLPLVAVFAASMAAISWPVLAVVAAVALAVSGFVMLKNAIGNAGGMVNFIKNSFLSMGQVVIGQIIKMLEAFNSFLDLLNKIPGVDINVDGAIEKLNQLNEKLEEDKEKKKEEKAVEDEQSAADGGNDAIAAEEDAKTELMLQKDAERNQALLDQQAVQREEKVALEQELAAIKDEEELAAFEEKLVKMQEQGQIITDLEAAAEQKRSEIKKANWAKDFSTWLGIEKLKVTNKQSTAQQMDNWESFMANSANSKNKSVAAVGKVIAKKDIVMKTAQAAMSAYQAMAAIPFAGPALGVAAALAAIQFGAEQYNAVDTPLAEGGSMIVDSPTRIGQNVLAGEAGPERIDVIPLSGGGGEQTINNIIQIDGETIATNVLKVGQRMRSEGTVDDGL